MENLYEFEEFGKLVFDDHKMRERLPKPVYDRYKETLSNENTLDRNTADAIAHAMKTWALELGATHYCHWFQPMSGLTAQKHDSFIEPDSNNNPILRFSGKSLIKGEPDASSFPNGGLRATFEARGYTYWDCTSYAFIKENVLCIPSVFVSYNGESLDKKSPLLKSCNAVNKAATKMCNILGDKDVKNVEVVVGLEQEYFLIDRKYYHKRDDIKLCKRSLFGASNIKCQEYNDHYFGSIPARVKEFMEETNRELFKLGIYAKSEHNEVAPGQFEIAPIFSTCNLAIDQNLLIMDVLTKTARKHDFACLLHEKPFLGINGSGKHNNYSLVTNTKLNLFDPGDKPSENIRFLVFVSAFIKAVDTYPELLRLSSSNHGNDYRLGSSEAPPAIISIYLGDYLENIILDLNMEEKNNDNFSPITNISYIPKDNTDRNRTSPVAFTGNKFEFRMLGSSLSASFTNTIFNTILAESLNEMSLELEGIKYREDIRNKAIELCKSIVKKHKRILFSEDGYSDQWIVEAEKRGLPNIKTYVESIKALTSDKSIKLFTNNNIYSKEEIFAREEILYDQFINHVALEKRVLLRIYNNDIKHSMYSDLNDLYTLKNSMGKGLKTLDNDIKVLEDIINNVTNEITKLEEAFDKVDSHKSLEDKAHYMRFTIFTQLEEVRKYIDQYEVVCSYDNYKLPTYSKILYY